MRIALASIPIFLAALSVAQQSLIKSSKRRMRRTEAEWSRLAAVIVDPGLHAVVAFCLIGLFLTLNLIFRYPDFGAVIQQYNQF
jgi:hypothetical protein